MSLWENILFDHIDCLHGSDPNETDKTMVSFDFRLALKDIYYDTDGSVNLQQILYLVHIFQKISRVKMLSRLKLTKKIHLSLAIRYYFICMII